MTTFGLIAASTTRVVKYIQSADPVDLTLQTDFYLSSVFEEQTPQAVAIITLAGGGDGHTFIVMIESAAAADVIGGFIRQDSGAPGVAVACYLAGEAEALTNARAALTDLLFAFPIADEQLAGASKGTRFMGMIVSGVPRVPS